MKNFHSKVLLIIQQFLYGCFCSPTNTRRGHFLPLSAVVGKPETTDKNVHA